jgi:uncharacterized membrane protein YfcA
MTLDGPVALYGSIVGFVVGLVGGGGGVLGVPILTYIVGVPSAHVAIGTSAVTVGVSAMLNLVLHARAGNVDWRVASVFSASGVLGVLLGNQLGLIVDSAKLMLFFGLLMLLIAAFMLVRAGVFFKLQAAHQNKAQSSNMAKIVITGALAGVLAGLFGIGGGVLVVPALIAATGMSAFTAIGTSLVAISVFSLITLSTYSYNALVDWNLAASYTAGALAGTLVGSYLCRYLARFKTVLSIILACIIGAVGISILLRISMG